MITFLDIQTKGRIAVGQRYIDSRSGLIFQIDETNGMDTAHFHAVSGITEYSMIICPNHVGMFSRCLGSEDNFTGGLCYGKRNELNLVG